MNAFLYQRLIASQYICMIFYSSLCKHDKNITYFLSDKLSSTFFDISAHILSTRYR